MNLEDMTKEELIAYIKEINGLLGAVDGDTIGSLKKFIRIYNITSWQINRYEDVIVFLIDKLSSLDKEDGLQSAMIARHTLSKIRGEIRKEVIETSEKEFKKLVEQLVEFKEKVDSDPEIQREIREKGEEYQKRYTTPQNQEDTIKVYVYRYDRGYGDGLAFALKEDTLSKRYDNVQDWWTKLGVFNLPVDFLKAIGWKEEEGDDYLEMVAYYE